MNYRIKQCDYSQYVLLFLIRLLMQQYLRTVITFSLFPTLIQQQKTQHKIAFYSNSLANDSIKTRPSPIASLHSTAKLSELLESCRLLPQSLSFLLFFNSSATSLLSHQHRSTGLLLLQLYPLSHSFYTPTEKKLNQFIITMLTCSLPLRCRMAYLMWNFCL